MHFITKSVLTQYRKQKKFTFGIDRLQKVN
nr:MAG TPA: hypothetical protein [Caudoviricetes sp.]